MDKILKILFFGLIVKPIAFIILGLNIRGREKLPLKGPAIIAANHNSHLDAMILMSLYPLSKIHKIRPVAAADYFLSNKLLAWFSLKCIGIIPLDRSGESKAEKLFSKCHHALDNGDILIIFPEGSRGKAEKISRIKKGLFYLAKSRGSIDIIPVALHGLGKSLPRGDALFVPFNCDIIIGDKMPDTEKSNTFSEILLKQFNTLLDCCLTKR